MVRLSLLAVLVFCLVGQIECERVANGLTRNGLSKKIMKELSDIKDVLGEIKQQGQSVATMELNQTQPENIQVAECPECGEYEICTNVTLGCELKGCEMRDMIKFDGTIVRSNNSEIVAEGRAATIMMNPNPVDAYTELEFLDMKFVVSISIAPSPPEYCETPVYAIEASKDCMNFTSTLPINNVQLCTNGYTQFPEPVLARCLRFLVFVDGVGANEAMNIVLYGCNA